MKFDRSDRLDFHQSYRSLFAQDLSRKLDPSLWVTQSSNHLENVKIAQRFSYRRKTPKSAKLASMLEQTVLSVRNVGLQVVSQFKDWQVLGLPVGLARIASLYSRYTEQRMV